MKEFFRSEFEDISHIYSEAEFGRIFSNHYKVPLMRCHDVFLNYKSDLDPPGYVCSIVMEEAKTDLNAILKKQKHPMTFDQFFPIFKDCILGLTFLHNQSIIHRDITPKNILQSKDDSYTLTDYGEGLNLKFKNRYQEEVQF